MANSECYNYKQTRGLPEKPLECSLNTHTHWVSGITCTVLWLEKSQKNRHKEGEKVRHCTEDGKVRQQASI